MKKQAAHPSSLLHKTLGPETNVRKPKSQTQERHTTVERKPSGQSEKHPIISDESSDPTKPPGPVRATGNITVLEQEQQERHTTYTHANNPTDHDENKAKEEQSASSHKEMTKSGQKEEPLHSRGNPTTPPPSASKLPQIITRIVSDNKHEDAVELLLDQDVPSNIKAQLKKMYIDGQISSPTYTQDELIQMYKADRIIPEIRTEVDIMVWRNSGEIDATWFMEQPSNLEKSALDAGWTSRIMARYPTDLFVGWQTAVKPATNVGDWAIGWQPSNVMMNDDLRYWCHGFALNTYDISTKKGFTIYSADVMRYMADNYDYVDLGFWSRHNPLRTKPPETLKKGDVVVFLMGTLEIDKPELKSRRTQGPIAQHIQKRPGGQTWARMSVPSMTVTHTAIIEEVAKIKGSDEIDFAKTLILEKPTDRHLRRNTLQDAKDQFFGDEVQFWRRKEDIKPAFNNLNYALANAKNPQIALADVSGIPFVYRDTEDAIKEVSMWMLAQLER
ncbi:hypothetical protein BKA66DRAFT_448481 [Pyrenochaeta sp. MPI-SDFR-AT-0127]|nr:hypothetical protein BKA66DRAFT_448481 [Pyrenochaeta sp. MPI-SDFR-AT-0127]